jgi:hypothetical protein
MIKVASRRRCDGALVRHATRNPAEIFRFAGLIREDGMGLRGRRGRLINLLKAAKWSGGYFLHPITAGDEADGSGAMCAAGMPQKVPQDKKKTINI